MKIFIVEDEKEIARAIGDELLTWGFQTVFAKDFSKIEEEVREEKPDLVLMDIGLPSFNGFYWCSKIRENSKVPLMFISSRDEDVDVIRAMQFGGDDYVVKPLHLPVLLAKIKALLRRSYEFSEDHDFLGFGGAKLLLSEVTLTFFEKRVELTKTELLILEVLFKEKGGVAKRADLMDRCWQEESFIDDNTLAVNINRLRKKLSAIGLQDFIGTKKGIGYFLNEEGLGELHEENS